MKFEETYFEAQINSADDIHKCTCQFMTLDEDNRPAAHASGVFIQVDNIPFIVTAAHVIDKHEEGLYVRFAKGLVRIEFESNKIKAANRDEDKTDIAVLKLTDKTIKALDGYYEFLNVEELGINHSDITDHAMYVAYGYPCSGTGFKYKTDIIESNPTFFTSKATDDINTFNKLECKTDKNLIIHYPQKKLVNVKTQKVGTGPVLNGMSGCGVWYIPMQAYNKEQKITKRLVAFLIEWPTKNRKFVINTRVDVLTEILRVTYNLPLPVSNIFQSTFDVEDV